MGIFTMRYDLCIKCSRTVLQKQLCQINQTLRMLLLINLFSFLIKIRWTNILGNQFFRDNQFSLFLFDGLKLIYWICHNLTKNKHEEFIVQKKDECSLFCGTFHNMFQTRHMLNLFLYRYQWEKIVHNPHERVLAKNHCRGTCAQTS